MLFRCPTIRSLAHHMEAAGQGAGDDTIPQLAEEDKPAGAALPGTPKQELWHGLYTRSVPAPCTCTVWRSAKGLASGACLTGRKHRQASASIGQHLAEGISKHQQATGRKHEQASKYRKCMIERRVEPQDDGHKPHFCAWDRYGELLAHLEVGIRLRGEVPHQVIQAALDGLTLRHEALRTRMLWQDPSAGLQQALVEPQPDLLKLQVGHCQTMTCSLAYVMSPTAWKHCFLLNDPYHIASPRHELGRVSKMFILWPKLYMDQSVAHTSAAEAYAN